jgi:hypothetical protein
MASVMTKLRDASAKVSGIMFALAEREAAASDKDVLETAAGEGTSIADEAARVRDVLLSGVLRAKKARLSRAHEAHQKAVLDLGVRTSRLPPDPSARRKLLAASLQRRPDMRQAVITLQHREFESFSDADVDSALKQLDALGLLDDEPEPKS